MDTWHSGIPINYRDSVVHGDLLRLLLSLPNESIDAVVTDPPYSSGGMFRGDRTGQSVRDKYQSNGTEKRYADFLGDTRDQRGYEYWLALWLAECWRVAKPGAPVMLFSDWRQLPVTTDAIQAGGWVWRGISVWDKTEAARPQKGRFRAQAEYIVWGSKGDWWSGDQGECLAGVFRQAVVSKDKDHITAKPLSVMRWLMQACPPAGVVLDPCIGSGTTGKAALESGRHFIGFELTDFYQNAAQALTGFYQGNLLPVAEAV